MISVNVENIEKIAAKFAITIKNDNGELFNENLAAYEVRFNIRDRTLLDHF